MASLRDIFGPSTHKATLQTLRAALGITERIFQHVSATGRVVRHATAYSRKHGNWKEAESDDSDSDASYHQERSEDEDFVPKRQEDSDEDDSGASSESDRRKHRGDKTSRRTRRKSCVPLYKFAGWSAPEETVQKRAADEDGDEDEEDTDPLVPEVSEGEISEYEGDEEEEEEEDEDDKDEEEEEIEYSSEDYMEDDKETL